MIKTEFIELYEELDKINRLTEDKTVTEAAGDDAVKKAASKKFWSAAKYGHRMEEEAFHTAFDDELEELGMMDMFDERGILADDYGRIKKAKEANPDSWALKALGTLWALRYKENKYFKAELEDLAKWKEEEKTRAAKETEERKKAWEFKTAEAGETLKTYISKVDPKLVADYEAAAGVSAEEGVTIRNEDPKFGICFKGWNRYYPVTEKEFQDEKLIIRKLSNGFTNAVEYINERKVAAEFEKIDIFAKVPNDSHHSLFAILLGESGKLYKVMPNTFGNYRFVIDGSTTTVPATIIDEPYEVIYTSSHWSDNNNSTRRDSHSSRSLSWNSKYANLIKNYIPAEDDYGISYGYIGSSTETTKKDNPNTPEYSHEPGIDSWAYIYYIDGATD